MVNGKLDAQKKQSLTLKHLPFTINKVILAISFQATIRAVCSIEIGV